MAAMRECMRLARGLIEAFNTGTIPGYIFAYHFAPDFEAHLLKDPNPIRSKSGYAEYVRWSRAEYVAGEILILSEDAEQYDTGDIVVWQFFRCTGQPQGLLREGVIRSEWRCSRAGQWLVVSIESSLRCMDYDVPIWSLRDGLRA